MQQCVCGANNRVSLESQEMEDLHSSFLLFEETLHSVALPEGEAVMTDDLGVQIHKRFFPKKWRCPCLALMLLSVFIAVGITFVPLVYLVRPHFNELALAIHAARP